MKNIAILTGAGISAESGLKTFRDSNGLWEGHDVMTVASPEGFQSNPKLVLDFYNQRRRQLLKVQPNNAHKALVHLEKHFNAHVITQNVDDLHERAGSSKVIHLHGELLKARSTVNKEDIFEWKKDILLGDYCKCGYQIRPHIVWFGEEVPLLDTAINITEQADIIIIIGTSMQVYPAASLINFAKPNTPIYFIDPNPVFTNSRNNHITVISKNAVSGVPTLVASLIDK
ncbi:SIR2 family NAD-dependent protein deacylase [Maribacter hydrothermalis]|uniref:NAD-dependent protein deacylase n=1 Tax=Maribacter hydrothermalis TaxID=1836467 RepID=A0A1B7Z7T4_9FLAO|nr:NAD-dependent deacylase [Maribacter hydrothermalis]APQ15862.1 NAD-dependent protein deacylase [Maribacter hydrothermalis]OBR38759.1 NAD-dependent protein deacylase [Maribacter hydrothermalis]